MAITVPGTQKLVAAASNQKPDGTVVYETADVVRAIPEAKLAAVKTVLQTHCNSLWGISYGGWLSPNRDARSLRARFKNMKTEAEVSTFLAAIETAVTT